MAFGRDNPPDRGIANLIGNMTDGLSRLFTEHLTLAKLELAQDAKVVGVEVGKIAALLPFVLIGYGFLCGALAMVLSGPLGAAGSLALVGGVNFLGGGLGILHAVTRLKNKQLLVATMSEVNESAQVLTLKDAASALPPPPEFPRAQ